MDKLSFLERYIFIVVVVVLYFEDINEMENVHLEMCYFILCTVKCSTT